MEWSKFEDGYVSICGWHEMRVYQKYHYWVWEIKVVGTTNTVYSGQVMSAEQGMKQAEKIMKEVARPYAELLGC